MFLISEQNVSTTELDDLSHKKYKNLQLFFDLNLFTPISNIVGKDSINKMKENYDMINEAAQAHKLSKSIYLTCNNTFCLETDDKLLDSLIGKLNDQIEILTNNNIEKEMLNKIFKKNEEMLKNKCHNQCVMIHFHDVSYNIYEIFIKLLEDYVSQYYSDINEKYEISNLFKAIESVLASGGKHLTIEANNAVFEREMNSKIKEEYPNCLVKDTDPNQIFVKENREKCDLNILKIFLDKKYKKTEDPLIKKNPSFYHPLYHIYCVLTLTSVINYIKGNAEQTIKTTSFNILNEIFSNNELKKTILDKRIKFEGFNLYNLEKEISKKGKNTIFDICDITFSLCATMKGNSKNIYLSEDKGSAIFREIKVLEHLNNNTIDFQIKNLLEKGYPQKSVSPKKFTKSLASINDSNTWIKCVLTEFSNNTFLNDNNEFDKFCSLYGHLIPHEIYNNKFTNKKCIYKHNKEINDYIRKICSLYLDYYMQNVSNKLIEKM